MHLRQTISDKLFFLENIGILDKKHGYSAAIMNFMSYYADNKKVQHIVNEYYFLNLNVLLDNFLCTEQMQTVIADKKMEADLCNDSVLSEEIVRITRLLDKDGVLEEKEEELFNESLSNLENDLRFIRVVSAMLIDTSRDFPDLYSDNTEIFHDRIGTLLLLIHNNKNEILGQEQISPDEINQFLHVIVLEIIDRINKNIEDATVIEIDESSLSWVDQQKFKFLSFTGASPEQLCNLVPAYRDLIFNPNIIDEVKSEHTEDENLSDDEFVLLIGNNGGDIVKHWEHKYFVGTRHVS